SASSSRTARSAAAGSPPGSASSVLPVPSVEPLSAASCDPMALAVDHLDPDPGRLAVLGVQHHHVREMDRPLLLDHAAHLLRALRAGDLLRLLVTLDDVQALDIDLLLLRVDAQHLAAFAAVLAADHLHLVVGL